MSKDDSDIIFQASDGFFNKFFRSIENTRAFLGLVLPEKLKTKLDLSSIDIEDTKYVSNKFEKGFSDMVVKTLCKH